MGKTPFVVYVLPVILSVGLGALVMAEALNEPDRSLNMWQFTGSEYADKVTTDRIQIIGLESQYDVSEPIEFQIKIHGDDTFVCGDLYITIYKISDSTKDVITQSGFLNQCYGTNNSYLPIDENYSEILNEAGNYQLLVEIYDKTYKQTSSLVANLVVN